MDLFYTFIALLAIGLPVFDVIAWIILRRASRIGPRSAALEERKDVALILAIAAQLLGILGINRVTQLLWGVTIADSPWPLIILSGVVILISLPSVIFLKRYLYGDFKGD